MIKELRNDIARETGVINRGMYEEIKKLFSKSPELAGEFAIALFELIITGEHSSDDFTIDLLLTNHKITNEKNKQKYERAKETKEQNRIDKLQLREIADRVNKGMKQNDIAKELEVSPGCISKRITIIRTEYPELLAEVSNQKNFQNFSYDNENVNVNENVNDNVKYDERNLPVSFASSASPRSVIGFDVSNFKF